MSQKLRNIAIIAHVDHGKTTLVDRILTLGQLFKEHQKPGELIMDNNDLEKERGITILSKNASVRYKDYKINILDTPGHADFGGEVERVLNMADGVLLLVDAFEGPMPQTRFVLQKALQLDLKPIVVINKVDKPNCRPDEVQEAVYDLMFELDATEEQLEFPTVFGSAKMGWMGEDWQNPTDNINYLMDVVLEHVPPPTVEEGTPQLQITSLDYSSYVGRIAIGRLFRGELKENMPISLVKRDGEVQKSKIKELFVFEGLGKVKVEQVAAGDICALTGIEGFDIGDTVSDREAPESMPPITIDEPTMSMLFTINNSPFFGKEGKFVTSRHLKDRLDAELERNLALRVEDTDKPESYNVYGRGVLHLSVLIETMRREGYELQVGQPQVIIKEIEGKKHEPVEELTIDLPETVSGRAINLVTQRKGEMTNMETRGDRTILRFIIPSRGIIGLRNEILTATAGEAIMSHRFLEFQPLKGDIQKRNNGSLIAHDGGQALAYAIDRLQDRGSFFIAPGDQIYEGQIVGENARGDDLVVNLIKGKKLTNMRAAGSDDKNKIAPPIKFSLEESLEYIKEDEYVEITPSSLRLRKIHLKETDRKRSKK
ncbi:MAG: translational GTPase TypA [Bacteroidota bacterium]